MCLALASCAPKGSFELLLARIDAAKPDGAPDALFLGAAKRARNARDHLRLIARARTLERAALETQLAELGLRAFPGHPTLALSLAAARLERGAAVEALTLFDTILEPAEHPELYALAWTSAARAEQALGGTPPRAEAANLGVAAEALEDGAPLLAAALFAMEHGDRFGAERYFVAAVEKGSPSMPELAWDLGRFDLVLSSPPRQDADPSQPEASRSRAANEAIRRADAALLLGRLSLARTLYEELAVEAPYASWKPYEALALLAEGWTPSQGSPDPERARPGAAPDPETLAYYDGQLERRFPELPEARLARMARLIRQGRHEDAIALGRTLPGNADASLLAAAARLKAGDPARASLEALDAAERFASDGLTVERAIGMLVRSGAPWEAALAARRSRAMGFVPRKPWFIEALESTLSGELDAAIASLREGGAEEEGPEGAASLAVLLRERGRRKDAADAWAIAVDAALPLPSKARYRLEEGKDRLAAGDAAGARAAWSAALDLDPNSLEAARALDDLAP